MRCPICRQETFAKGNPFRPFCSQRCKLIDLGNWLAGRYRISTLADRQQQDEGVAGSEDTSGEMAGKSRESGE